MTWLDDNTPATGLGSGWSRPDERPGETVDRAALGLPADPVIARRA
ncbi:hypothetical protein ACWEO2_16545 [Nocardia sp. NPDC004278]